MTEREYEERIKVLNQAIREADEEADFWYCEHRRTLQRLDAALRRPWWRRWLGC